MRGRRRRVLLGIGTLLVGGAAWLRLFAGEPVLPGVPGGWLHGEPTSELPTDWSFANRDPYLLVESCAWTLPYSATVWFLAHEGRLHLLLPSFFGDGLQRHLADDPQLRVAFDGKIYEQVAERVGDADLGALLGPVIRRQFAIELGDGVSAAPPGGTARGVEMAVFRLVDPPIAGP